MEQWNVSEWCGEEESLPAGLVGDTGLHCKASQQDPDCGAQVAFQREGRHQRQYSVHAECPDEARGHGQFILPRRAERAGDGRMGDNRAWRCGVELEVKECRTQTSTANHAESLGSGNPCILKSRTPLR